MSLLSPKVQSPLVLDAKAFHQKNISVRRIKKRYKKSGIDTSYIFDGLKSLSVYECEESGYQFYYPKSVTGDSKFYEKLQHFDWYYMPWKWEHEVAKKFLKNEMSLLEVGCAHGAFIKATSDAFELKNVVGLELNQTTPNINKKWQIVNESVQDFQINNAGSFDVVCSFQVLEHIYDVQSFLSAKISCLKNGGKLIISVPNNESFIKNIDSVLNMPPHHIGLWTPKSLRYLEKIFPIKFIDFYFEPLQQYHVSSYVSAKHYAHRGHYLSRFLRKIDHIIGRYQKFESQVEAERDSITGHTLLAVFEKRAPQS